MKYRGGVYGAAPMTAFLPCSLSNTVSSYSQYASLKYVSFPMQSIFKSAKVIPVMIMGKIVQNILYSLVEYTEACMITIGKLALLYDIYS
jgi:adenosine 3'-phospho 5'-phosphosulfate transporter B2